MKKLFVFVFSIFAWSVCRALVENDSIDLAIPVPTPSYDIDDFICLDDGVFPDMDCTRYHVCINMTSTGGKCPDGERFDASTGNCSQSADCGTFDCSSTPETRVAHSLYPGFYTLCPHPDEPLVVAACPPRYSLNVTSQACEPHCTTEEVIPDVTDCHYYFKCTYSGTSLVVTKEMCPPTQAYNPVTLLCTDEKEVDACKK